MQDWRKQKCHKVTVSDFEIDSVETGMRYNWWQSVAECNRMSREQGYTPCYSLHGETDERKWGTPPESCEFDIMEVWANIECDFNANGYRLPTTAEWEWAARGGTKSKGYKYSGSNNIDEVAWYDGNTEVDKRYFDRGGPAPDINGNLWQTPAQKKPNELGLYDMSGNMSEWCWDWYWPYSEFPQTNPTGYSDSKCSLHCKSLRGGGWTSHAESCEVTAYDCGETMTESTGYVAFRVCRSLTADHYDTITLEDNDTNRQALKPVMKYVPCANAPESLNIEPYELAETELSRELYSLVRGTELYQPEGNLPQEGISWYEAVELCNLLSMMYGYTPCYSLRGKTDPKDWHNKDGLAWKKMKCNFSADGYRLPTETEWNFAAESGKTGEKMVRECWYGENSGGRSHAVLDSKWSNALGMYNIYGNVQEWCWDAVAKNSPRKVLKGGDYGSSREQCSWRVRSSEMPDSTELAAGLRLCRSLDRTLQKKGFFAGIIDFFASLFGR